jgi:hypothetical protein
MEEWGERERDRKNKEHKENKQIIEGVNKRMNEIKKSEK